MFNTAVTISLKIKVPLDVSSLFRQLRLSRSFVLLPRKHVTSLSRGVGERPLLLRYLNPGQSIGFETKLIFLESIDGLFPNCRLAIP